MTHKPNIKTQFKKNLQGGQVTLDNTDDSFKYSSPKDCEAEEEENKATLRANERQDII